MADTVAAKKTCCKVVRVTSLTTMRSQNKGIEATLFSPNIERCDVGKHEVNPIAIWRILFCVPVLRNRVFAVKSALCFAFIVDTVKSNNTLKKNVQFRVAPRVLGDLKQWLKNIRYDLLKIFHHATRFVYIIQTRDLDQPTNIRGKQFVINHPGSKFVPFLY